MKLQILPILLLASAASIAAEPGHSYAGQQSRQIKALDAEQVAGLLAGRGMGYAKAAELNRYPGPAHVLELAGPLALSEAQAASTRDIHARMERQAQALGAQLVAAEADLDRLFQTGTADAEGVAAALATIARLQAQLRGVHLNAHIEQRELLSAEQVERYVQLRGYGGQGDGAHGHSAHGHGAQGHGAQGHGAHGHGAEGHGAQGHGQDQATHDHDHHH